VRLRLGFVLRDSRFQIVCLFLVALSARLIFTEWMGWFGRIVNNDAHEYNQITLSLLQGHGFAFGPGEPTAFRPFGYPVFLAIIYGVLGPSVVWVQCIQALLGALLVVPTYTIARYMGGQMIAILAGFGVALHPVLVYQTALLAPEVVAVLFQMLLLWFALSIARLEFLRGTDLLGFVLSGALATLMRPELLLITWLLALGFLAYAGIRSSRVRAILVASVLTTILAVGVPVIRNWLVFHAFIPFPTVGGVTFWGANNASVHGGWVLPSAETWPDGEPPTGMRGWDGLTELQTQARFYQASFDWVRQNPNAALALIPCKLARSWTLSFADEARSSTLPPIAGLANWAFGLVVLAGVLIFVRRRTPYMWLLFVPIVAWFFKTLVFYGSARQTAPVLPILCIFGSIALQESIERLILRRR